MPDQTLKKNLKKKNCMELEFRELEFHLNCMKVIETKNCMKTQLQGFKTLLQENKNVARIVSKQGLIAKFFKK